MVKAHRELWNEQKLAVEQKRPRWAAEEHIMLARKEAQLLESDDPPRHMNLALLRVLPNRTLESIKSFRKRPDYKELLAEQRALLRNQQQVEAAARLTGSPVATVPGPRRLINLLGEPLEEVCEKSRRVNEICVRALSSTIEETLCDISIFIREALLPAKTVSGSRPINTPRPPQNRKQRKRDEYKRIQDLWKKNPGRCTHRVLSDQVEQVSCVPRDAMEPFWRAIMTTEKLMFPVLRRSEETYDNLWLPITGEEVKSAFPPSNTAAGPDGIITKQLRSLNSNLVAKVFNILMYCGKLPAFLSLSRTVLVPKVKEPSNPGEYRPIAVSSVWTRTFHKVLANRLKTVTIDARQRAFLATDGCSDNIMLLDLVLRYHKEKSKNLFIAILDMAKAFDSVSFPALSRTLAAKGVPRPMIDYIMTYYSDSNTVLQHDGWHSTNIHATCGVKQGDPLSPLLFNFVIDEMIAKLPPGIGVDVDGMRLNVLAFADDLILIAATETGLQNLLDEATGFLKQCGLEANNNKCATIAITNVPKRKQIAVDHRRIFNISGQNIPALRCIDQWKYLGVQFNMNGRMQPKSLSKLVKNVKALSKASLKPQQKLFALRTIVLPGLYHELSLGKSTISQLRAIDRAAREAVRKWLHLPHDCPNAYIHASIADGGLGVPSVRLRAPLLRLNRLKALTTSNYIVGRAKDKYLELEITSMEQRLRVNGVVLTARDQLDGRWAEQLHDERFDGMALKYSKHFKQQHAWVGDGTKFLSGRDYVGAVKLRINALPCRARCKRGRAAAKLCRGGCNVLETNNHILQQCHRTHGPRIKRHNAVADYVAKLMVDDGYAVHKEPRIRVGAEFLVPDVIGVKAGDVVVVDAQVVSDKIDVDVAHATKRAKYQGVAFLNEVRRVYSGDTSRTLTATLNWRGIWSPKSARELLDVGIIMKRHLKIFSTRVLIGGVSAHRVFNQTTSMVGRRTGVG